MIRQIYFIVALILGITLQSHCIAFEAPVFANTTDLPSYSPAIAVSEYNGQTIYHIAYNRESTNASNAVGVFYIKSIDHGQTWSAPVNVSGIDNGIDVSITARDNFVYCVYFAGSARFSRSSDGGETFDIIDQTITSGAGFRAEIAVDSSNRLHLVIDRLYFSSNDNGQNWSAGGPMGDDFSWRSDVAVDEVNVYAVAINNLASETDSRYLVFRKPLSGGSWETIEIASVPKNQTAYAYPSISVKNNRICVVFDEGISFNSNDPALNDIFYTFSENRGVVGSWSTPQKIGVGYVPEIAQKASGELLAVWYSAVGSNVGEVNVARSLDMGSTWNIEANPFTSAHIVQTDGHQHGNFLLNTPFVISHQRTSIVGWLDRDTDQIKISREVNSADEFNDPYNANSTFTPSFAPVMAISNNGNDAIYHLAYFSFDCKCNNHSRCKIKKLVCYTPE